MRKPRQSPLAPSLGLVLALVTAGTLFAACSSSSSTTTTTAAAPSTTAATTTTSSTTTSTTAPPPALSSFLLTISDFPAGWVAEKSSSGGGVGCLVHVLKPAGITESATAGGDFALHGNVPEVDEKLATYEEPATTAYSSIVRAVDACKTVTGTVDGQPVKGSVAPIAFPHYGDQSSAFRAIFTVSGTTLGEDAIIVRKGDVVMGLLEGTVGTPSVSQFKGFIVKAVAALP